MDFKKFEAISKDSPHWYGKLPPLCPNAEEIAIYEQYVYGSVCMLGMTQEISHLCDFAIDVCPTEIGKPTISANWLDIDVKVNVFIGDGVLNLAEFPLLEVLKTRCDLFVCRVFTRRFDWMKYAEFFPTEFPYSPTTIPTQDGVMMVIWKFFEQFDSEVPSG